MGIDMDQYVMGQVTGLRRPVWAKWTGKYGVINFNFFILILPNKAFFY